MKSRLCSVLLFCCFAQGYLSCQELMSGCLLFLGNTYIIETTLYGRKLYRLLQYDAGTYVVRYYSLGNTSDKNPILQNIQILLQ